MKKILTGFLVAAFVLTPLSSALAATLTASCAGTLSGSSMVWTGQAGGGVSPYTYLWNNGATTSSQTVTAVQGTTTMTFQVTDASSTVATTTCTTFVPVTATVPVKRNQVLHIEDNGQFQAKGMIVKSVGTGSFTAEVYGITYTIMTTQSVTLGNYVDVTGRIKDGTPLTVDARKVKERPSTKPVTPKNMSKSWFKSSRDDQGDDHGKGNGKGKGRGGKDD